MGGSDILRGFSLRQLKKLLATRELAFEIIQQRKQSYWELGALFSRDREEIFLQIGLFEALCQIAVLTC